MRRLAPDAKELTVRCAFPFSLDHSRWRDCNRPPQTWCRRQRRPRYVINGHTRKVFVIVETVKERLQIAAGAKDDERFNRPAQSLP
jgi:hypothetical protein